MADTWYRAQRYRDLAEECRRGLFDELDKLRDTQRFLISGARAASRWETVRRCLGLNRSQRLGARGRRGTENDRRRKRKSVKEAGASRGQGGLLILTLKLSISRVSLSEGSLLLTKTLPPRFRADREAAKSRGRSDVVESSSTAMPPRT